MSITYTVNIGNNDTITGIETPEEAERMAIQACEENPGQPVYVTWFRESDGQHAYLNRGGNHELTGRDWQPRIGRPKTAPSARTVSKSITLRPDEWAALAEADPDGSPTREAVRRLRASLAPSPRNPDAQR